MFYWRYKGQTITWLSLLVKFTFNKITKWHANRYFYLTFQGEKKTKQKWIMLIRLILFISLFYFVYYLSIFLFIYFFQQRRFRSFLYVSIFFFFIKLIFRRCVKISLFNPTWKTKKFISFNMKKFTSRRVRFLCFVTYQHLWVI